jgi:ribosome-associated protein
MADALDVNHDVSIPLTEIELRTSRSSGPGGQHANVTASRVEASFDVAESAALTDEQKDRVACALGDTVTAVAQDTRSQARNRELALERLAGKLAAALTPPKERRATRPSKAKKERRLEDKRRTGQRKRERQPPGPDD